MFRKFIFSSLFIILVFKINAQELNYKIDDINNLLPLKRLDTLKIALIEFGNSDGSFIKNLQRYERIDLIGLPAMSYNKWFIKQDYNLLIVLINKSSDDENLFQEISKIKIRKIICTEKSLKLETSEKDVKIYSEHFDKDLLSQYIFAGKPGNKDFFNLRFASPSQVGADSAFLYQKVDSIVNRGIQEKAFPCCRIIAAKNGTVFFDKSYGFHTYDSITPLKPDDLFDLASVTKITGPLPALMKLYEENKYDLDDKMSLYIKELRKSNKKDITFRETLTHQAGLYPWIPFWKLLKDKNNEFNKKYVRDKYSKKFSTPISDSLYMKPKFKKEIYKSIKESALEPEKKYKYSDLGFIMFPDLITKLSKQNYESYIKKNFYSKIGAYTLTYNPLNYFRKEQIVPTEYDKFFRKTQITGYVHDEAAAVMGGVSGNAGLFATAYDMLKIMQLYLNYGNFAGEQIIQSNTVKEFTKIQYPENGNRRGLGFDKPLLKNRQNGSCAVSASNDSFGHSGFTGTFVWADPDNGLVYIFMSNRVYPTRENSKIMDLNIRPSIHQVLYDCFKK